MGKTTLEHIIYNRLGDVISLDGEPCKESEWI